MSLENKYGVFAGGDVYYISNEYLDESKFTPGFFPVDSTGKIGWVAIDFDHDPESDSYDLDIDEVKKCSGKYFDYLTIEKSRSGYHFYIFLEDCYNLELAESFIYQFQDNFINLKNFYPDLVYPSGKDGNSFYLKNTNDIIIESDLKLDLRNEKVEIIDFCYSNKNIKFKNYYMPDCFLNIDEYYHIFPENFHGSNGHHIRIFYCNYLLMLGKSDQEIAEKFKIFNDFNERKTLYYIRKLRERGYSPPSCIKLSDYMGEACDYCKSKFFLKNQLYHFDLIKKNLGGKTFFKKYTRAGFTTSVIQYCLKNNLKLLLIEPNHKIEEVMLYVGEEDYIHIYSNRVMCEKAKQIYEITQGIKEFIPRGNCKVCKLDCDYKECYKRIQEGDFKIIYMTYHKFALSDFDLSKVDLIFFDEFASVVNMIKTLRINELGPFAMVNRFKDIVDKLNFNIESLKKLKNGIIYNINLSKKDSLNLIEYAIYLSQIIDKDSTILSNFFLFPGEIIRMGNLFFNFYLFHTLIRKIRNIDKSVIATDTFVPEFIKYCFNNIESIKDNNSTDEKFKFIQTDEKPAGCYVINQGIRNNDEDYFRSSNSRGIKIDYDKPLYLAETPHIPGVFWDGYTRFLKYLGIDEINIDEYLVNEIYQSISRFKTPFLNDQKIIVYYDSSLEMLINLLRYKINNDECF